MPASNSGLNVVHFDGRKWPDLLHWQLQAKVLGEDEHGVWLYTPAGTVAQRGHEEPRPLKKGFISVIPHAEWWIVEFYWDHPRYAVYVNIGTPPTWHENRVHQIDLDLDVVRHVDGTVEVLDEDEFAEHQEKYAYPADLVVATRRAADRAVSLLQTQTEPFGTTVERWLVAAGHGPRAG